MSEWEDMVQKVKNLQFKHDELDRRIPKLVLLIDEKEKELSSLNRHSANMMAQIEKDTTKFDQQRTEHNERIKLETDALNEAKAKWEAEYKPRLDKLEQREVAVAEQDKQLEKEAGELEDLAGDLIDRKALLDEREAKVVLVEADNIKKLAEIKKLDADLTTREVNLKTRKLALEDHEATVIAPRVAEIDKLHLEATNKHKKAQELLSGGQERFDALDAGEKQLISKELLLDKRAKELNAKEVALNDRASVYASHGK